MERNNTLIGYEDLKEITQSRLLHEPFWMLASNRSSHEIEGRSVIVLEEKVDEYITNLANTLPEKTKRWPFYLQHQDMFKGAQIIFRKLFGESADTLILYYYKKDHTQSAYFFTSEQLLKKAYQNETLKFSLQPNKTPTEFKKKIAKYSDYAEIADKIKSLGMNFQLPARLFPIIGTYNDVTGNKSPNYNLILGSFSDSRISTGIFDRFYEMEEYENLRGRKDNPFYRESEQWFGQFDSSISVKYFHEGFPAYCIKRLNLYDSPTMRDFDPHNMTEFMKNAVDITVDEFKSTLFHFTLGNIIGKTLKLSAAEFKAVMPHFYKLDRTKTSVDKHKELVKSLRNKYKVASEYADGKANLTISDFIQFFLQNALISRDELAHCPGIALDKALTERRPIKNLFGKNEIISNFLGPSGAVDYEEFLNGQIDAYNRILQDLK